MISGWNHLGDSSVRVLRYCTRTHNIVPVGSELCLRWGDIGEVNKRKP